MKKIRASYSEKLPSARLYLDDIEAIFEIISTTSEETRILTEWYELDEVDELRELEMDVIHTLSFGGQRPRITLELIPDKIVLYIADKSDTVSLGIFEKIKAIIKNRKRRFRWLWSGAVLGVLMTLIVFSLAGTLYSLAVLNSRSGSSNLLTDQLALYLPLILVSSIILFIIGLRNSLKTFTIIHLTYKKDNPSFFKRKKDDIILAVISAIIGGLITLGIAALIGQLP